MLAEVLFYGGLAVSLVIGFLYFRDLGDVSQMVLKVSRENTVRFLRNEYKLAGIGLAAFAVMLIGSFMGGGPGWLQILGIPLIAFLVLFLYAFPWIWVHVGLRNQQNTAKFYPIAEARDYIHPSASVLVVENNGKARAHSDAQLMRPHLAGNDEGLGGEDVIMTYCAMANLGIGYSPTIEGQKLNLEVLAQHGNNLILRDNTTGEPIQHIYGFRDRDKDPKTEGAACPLRPALAMKPWPTYRMTFRGFEKAYPDGDVFLNKPASNPLLKVFDLLTETVFSASIARHHQEAAPVMDNMTHFDDRLPNKTYVWGVNIGDDAVAWTDDFIGEHNPINASVGGRDLVVAYDPKYESIGVWYNDTGSPITEIDFWGQTPAGKLERVETLKPGMFWHVWVEFFPHTDINRVGAPAQKDAA